MTKITCDLVTIVLVILGILTIGIVALKIYHDGATIYGFVTVDGVEMEGRYCGTSAKRAYSCEAYDGRSYQIKEYWEIEK